MMGTALLLSVLLFASPLFASGVAAMRIGPGRGPKDEGAWRAATATCGDKVRLVLVLYLPGTSRLLRNCYFMLDAPSCLATTYYLNTRTGVMRSSALPS